MQIFTQSNINNTQPAFGMRVSKVGRQIDKVLSQEGTVQAEVRQLRLMLDEYFRTRGVENTVIGEGHNGRVFGIDDKYVCKCWDKQVPEVNRGQFSLLDEYGAKPVEGLKTYFGGILMRLGNVKILRNVSSDGKHMQAGIPYSMMDMFSSEELQHYYNNIYLPTFAKLPQRSFDSIAGDFAALNRKGNGYNNFQFDTNNPNNIVLVGTSTLRIVDELYPVIDANPNRVCGLLDMFLNKANVSIMAPITDENRALRFEMFKKIMLASEKHGLPLSTNRYHDDDVWNRVCNFGQPETGEEIVQILTQIRNTSSSPKESFERVGAFLDNMQPAG